jgi:hypothetical protein
VKVPESLDQLAARELDRSARLVVDYPDPDEDPHVSRVLARAMASFSPVEYDSGGEDVRLVLAKETRARYSNSDRLIIHTGDGGDTGRVDNLDRNGAFFTRFKEYLTSPWAESPPLRIEQLNTRTEGAMKDLPYVRLYQAHISSRARRVFGAFARVDIPRFAVFAELTGTLVSPQTFKEQARGSVAFRDQVGKGRPGFCHLRSHLPLYNLRGREVAELDLDLALTLMVDPSTPQSYVMDTGDLLKSQRTGVLGANCRLAEVFRKEDEYPRVFLQSTRTIAKGTLHSFRV